MATNFINKILTQISTPQKNRIYMSITPGVGLEIAQIDGETNAIVQYGFKHIEYNEALKEIVDFEELKNAMEELFNELKLDTKALVVLSIPTVHIGKIELPLILSDEMIEEAIISEVEQSYIFKRTEPVVSWTEVLGNPNSETRTIIYSAIQKTAFNKIKEIITSFGATLEKIEISLVSNLRALYYSGIAEKQMADDSMWTLMTVKSTGYELVQLNGKKIFDYYEEPLALKTYGIEEIYDAINTSVQIALLNYPTNNVIVLSETDMVSAELLISKMQTEGNFVPVENNSLKKQELVPVSLEILPDLVPKITLEVAGVAATEISDFPSVLEIFGSDQKTTTSVELFVFKFRGKRYELDEKTMCYIVLIIGATLLIPFLILIFTLFNIQKNIKVKLDSTNSQIQSIDQEIASLQNNTGNRDFNVNAEIESVIKHNRAKLIAYSALGESVPKKLSVKYFNTKDDGKIDIIGVSDNVEEIYVFYRNLKDSIIDSKLRLHKLEMSSKSIDDAVISNANYEFEITNIPESELNAKKSDGKNNDANKADASKNAANNNNKTGSVKDLEEVEVH